MSLTLKPLLRCNLDCVDCYERSTLHADNPRPAVAAMIATMARLQPGADAVLHGGEVTLLTLAEAEALCQAAQAQGRALIMQTNATLLTPAWLDLIDRYAINVGVSINGPAALNRGRQVPGGNVAATDRMTARVHAAIEQLATQQHLGSLIVVLSQDNAGTDAALEALIAWAAEWAGATVGAWSLRFNCLFGASQLTPERAAVVYRRLLEATVADARRAWLPFRELIDNLSGLGLQPCWMRPCDPYHTDAVHAIFGDGSEGSCLRTSPDGTPWQRTEAKSFLRQDLLYQIPMAEGGCGGCRYWNFCHGGCPAEGEGGDWRNKTRWCLALYQTYEAIERGLSGWLPNWRPATTWVHPDPLALGASIDARKPLVRAFGAMVPEATSASTYERRTVPVD